MRGQRFLIDLVLVPLSATRAARATGSRTPSATATPRDLAVEIATGQRFDLIERLAAVIADALLARLPLARATVRVHKPGRRSGTRSMTSP